MARRNTKISETKALSNQKERLVTSGDVSLVKDNGSAQTAETVNRKIRKKLIHNAVVLNDKLVTVPEDQKLETAKIFLSNYSESERKFILDTLLEDYKSTSKILNKDLILTEKWQDGGYPYKYLMSRKNYEMHKYQLQVELLKLQAWVKNTGARVIIIYEGRDAAGKGGTIKRIMEHLNPRGARVVALEKPTEEERGQWYFQRYIKHLPTKGEHIHFERS